ncbi:MAG: hypothetical protein EU540_05320 [Promethearchaeota archaeon]|nr:MAG: hypothetical protein EU540_05320 [Candidatus Lokiarchaeota archaeon]
MTAKPPKIKKETVYTYWESDEGMICPLCGKRLTHEFNDGGREVKTLKGSLWVITNYYKCSNLECELHDAFPITHSSCIKRKRHSVEVWAKVIQHHFKYHLNYRQVAELLWDDWEISISESTVRNICQYFEMAGLQHKNKEVREKVRKNGKIFLSLDGAQPIEGEPALWIFTDRLSDTVLFARLLESAPAEILHEIYYEIENKFGVSIAAVISDKQPNIVNSVKEFNPNIPHVYCQYHFLNHITTPINAKDSHLRTTLKKTVRSLSLVQNEPAGKRDIIITKSSPVADVFVPITEELKCAVSAKGNQYDTFAGKESYLNLEYVLKQLESYQIEDIPKKVVRSLNALIGSLKKLLDSTKPLFDEICSLIYDFRWLRAILGHRDWSGDRIKKWVGKWLSILHQRLERHSMEVKPEELKWQYPCSTMKLQEVWQQWIRLENSYSDGLYRAYNDPALDFTNNAKEQLIHHTKAHFKSLFGRQNIARAYQSRGSLYAHLIDFDYSNEHVSSVLLASETPLIEVNRREHNAQYTVTRRKWRIREEETGNFILFKQNLQALKNEG